MCVSQFSSLVVLHPKNLSTLPPSVRAKSSDKESTIDCSVWLSFAKINVSSTYTIAMQSSCIKRQGLVVLCLNSQILNLVLSFSHQLFEA